MIVSIDFDNTIVEGDYYPKIGKLQKGTKEVINGWHEDGNIIIINSCRTGRYEGMAVDFLKEHDIKFNYFNCNYPASIEKYKMDCRKISADIYIDDKSITGILPWNLMDTIVRNHKLYITKSK